jgi:hypothetical protein
LRRFGCSFMFAFAYVADVYKDVDRRHKTLPDEFP